MKKAILTIAVLTFLLSVLSVAVQGASAIGEVKVPYAKTAPILDGVIRSGEWTGGKSTFSKDTATLALSTAASYDMAKFNFSFDCYYAWDEDYLYVAWDMQGEDMWFDVGGNYIRMYIDPNGILNAYAEAQNDEAKGAMPRLVAAVKKDGSGVFGLQHLGVDNIDYIEDEDYALTLKENNKGWVIETRVAWSDMQSSVIAKTGNNDVTIVPKAGYTLRANYDCYHVTPDKSNKGFLTTSMEQELNAKNVWNYSKYTNITLTLPAKDAGTVSPPTGSEITLILFVCAASLLSMWYIKKHRNKSISYS